MNKSLLKKTILLVTSYALLVTSLCGCQRQQLYKDSRVMMGTFVEVISPDKAAANIAFTEIKRIEGLLSKYKEDSEIVRLNRLGELKVSADTFYILQKAKELWKASDGAFDITVGPLMDLWGFTDRRFSIPSKEKIKNVLNSVGSGKIILIPEDNVVKFMFSGMKLDLGAIAKGYALDCAVKKLKENRIPSCLINAGGQVYCLGERLGQPWKIAIKDPRSQDVRDCLKLKNQSVATSGDYEQYFMHRNKRYAHILNPKTGYPADAGVVSVTVIAPDGLTADALSTAIFVLGKDKGLKLAQQFQDVQVKVIEGKDVSHNP